MVIPKEHGIFKINTQPSEANGSLFQEHLSLMALFNVKHWHKIILLYRFSKHLILCQVEIMLLHLDTLKTIYW
jgi:hypothetical protein